MEDDMHDLNISRRALAAGLALAPVAGLPTLALGGELETLIEAYRGASEAFLMAFVDLEKLEDAWKAANDYSFFVESFLGGGCGSSNGLEGCKEIIARGYKFHRERMDNLEQISPQLTEQLRVVLDAKEMENMAAIDAAFDDENARKEAFGLGAAKRRWTELRDAEDAAAMALCAYRCRTLDEARAKAAAILASPMIDELGDCETELLQSFVGGGEALA
jgi:hypothetical protein